LTDNTL